MSKLSEFFAAPPETVPVQIFMVGGGGSGAEGFGSGTISGNGGSGAVYIGTLDLVSEQQITYTLGSRSLKDSGTRGGTSIISFTDPITEQEVIINVPGGGSASSNPNDVLYTQNVVTNDDILATIRPNTSYDGGCSAWTQSSGTNFSALAFGNCTINGTPSGPIYVPRYIEPPEPFISIRAVPDPIALSYQIYEQTAMGGKVYGVEGLMSTPTPGGNPLRKQGFVGYNLNITLTNTDNSFEPNYLIYSPTINPNENTPREEYLYAYGNAILRGKGGRYDLDDSTGGAILFAYPSVVGSATFGSSSVRVTTTIVNNASNGLTVMEQAITSGNGNFTGSFTAPIF